MRICHLYSDKLHKSAHRFFIVYCCVFGFFLNDKTLQAQSMESGNRFFEAQQYYKASTIYEKIVARDSSNFRAAYQLAHCYRYMYDYQSSEKYYTIVAKNASHNFPLSLFYYAQMLKYNQQYEEAIKWYDQFLAKSTDKSSAIFKQATQEKQGSVQALIENPVQNQEMWLHLLPEPINTVYQEFAPAIYQQDSSIIFSSTRLSKRLQNKNKVSNRSGEAFSNQYIANGDSIGWHDQSKENNFSKLNSKWSDASGTFTADGNEYYFTRCSASSEYCNVFFSRKKSGKWQDAKALSEVVNFPGSNNKHPAISSGGDTLFFVSDRSGGLGGSDIWMSIKDENESWQAALNLGEPINTGQDEISPFYHGKDSLLIFASDGKQGKGGMDIYMMDFSQKQNDLPIALPLPFNSSKDDCYLVLGKNRGYMTSNRDGNFDIYAFEKTNKQSFRQFLQGATSGLSAQIPKKGEVFEHIITDYSSILKQREENLTVMRSSGQDYLRNGASRFVLSSDVNDILLEQLRDQQALSEGTTATLSPNNNADSLSESNLLISFSTFQANGRDLVEINGNVINAVDSALVAKLSLYLLDENGNITKITTTNERGEFRFINLEASTSYQIRSANTENNEDYRIRNLKVFGYGDDFSTINFENIYFDFNQSYLRGEARVALDKLADFYYRYPSSVIEINAFTDSTGNDTYNLQLSRERGQEAFDYLLQKGVDRSSLVFNAKGVSTAITSSNAYVTQQLNRRIEFNVTGRNIRYEPDIVTRMIRPEVTLYTLSNATGMDLEEIKSMNGMSANEIQAYKPIRVYQWALKKAPALFYQMKLRSEQSPEEE